MRVIHLRAVVTLIATLTAVNFIILSYLFPKHSVVFLSIEVVLLPAVYIIGNYYIEYLIKEEDKELIENLSSKVEGLEQELANQIMVNQDLKNENKHLNNRLALLNNDKKRSN